MAAAGGGREAHKGRNVAGAQETWLHVRKKKENPSIVLIMHFCCVLPPAGTKNGFICISNQKGTRDWSKKKRPLPLWFKTRGISEKAHFQ